VIAIAHQLQAIQREVRHCAVASGEGIGVLVRREYAAPIGECWLALTDPERLKRWFLPVGGELRVGGTFQTEGNAGGEILRCEAPRLLRVTWGGETSVVELRLVPVSDTATVIELDHTVPIEIAGGGAGALFVGPGWDGALMALGLYLGGEISADPAAAAASPEAQEFSRRSAHAWAAAIEASGTATAGEITAMTAMVMGHWAPDSTPASE
jgi:uncharacterized protein YndB with AHSA1/START domain